MCGITGQEGRVGCVQWKELEHDVAIPLRGLEGVPGLPGAPQDEAGLTRKFARGLKWEFGKMDIPLVTSYSTPVNRRVKPELHF